MLLLSVTVGLAGAFGLLMTQWSGPVERPHTDLLLSLAPGASGWGTGDESVKLAHRGGDELRDDQVAIALNVDGGRIRYEGASLGGPLSDGRWSIGETWDRTLSVPACATVYADVSVLGDRGSEVLLTHQSTRAETGACPGGL